MLNEENDAFPEKVLVKTEVYFEKINSEAMIGTQSVCFICLEGKLQHSELSFSDSIKYLRHKR